MRPKARLLTVTVLALIAIDIGSVWSVWGEVLAGRPDFTDLYGAGYALSHGKIPNYGVAPNSAPMRDSVATQRVDRLHPAFEMPIFIVLSKFSFITAYRIWLVCNLLMLWAIPWLLWRYVPNLHTDFHYVIILFGSFISVIVALVQGQDSILLLFLLTLSFILLKQNRYTAAGAALGLAMFKFMLVIPLLAFLVVARKSKVLMGCAASSLGMFLISGRVIGIRNAVLYYVFLVRFAGDSSSIPAESSKLMPNLRGLVATVVGQSSSPDRLLVIAAVSSFILLILTFIWAVQNQDSPLDLQFSLFLSISVFCSFHFFVHNAVVLLLPLLLAANEIAGTGTTRRTMVIFGAAVCTMYALPKILPMWIGMPLIALSTILLSITLLLKAREWRQLRSTTIA